MSSADDDGGQAAPLVAADTLAREQGLTPHWVLCTPLKRPTVPRWLQSPASIEVATAHLASGGLVGLVPASLGMVVVDIDSGGDSAERAVEARLGAPLATARTPAGGAHLYYACARAREGVPQGNQKWALPDGAGDLRGSRGQVIAWEPEAVVRALRAVGAEAVDAGATLPRPGKPTPIDRIASAPEGARNDTLNREMYHLARDGTLTAPVEDAAVRAAQGVGLNLDEIRRTVKSAKTSGGEDRVSDKKGRLTPERLSAMLTHLDVKLRYNTRAQIQEYRERGGAWECMTDLAEDDLYHRVANDNPGRDGTPLRIARETWRSSLNALLHRNRRDPFLDRLNEYPEWDGVERLHAGLAAPFDDADGEPGLVDWAGAAVFLAIVARALHPGMKHDEVVVLVGPQGAGKSEWCAGLFDADQRDALHCDTLSLTARPRDRVEALSGAALVELSEMGGATRGEVEDVKAFVSTTHDKVRLAYRRNAEVLPRRCVFVATTNDPAALPNDPSGNRRFVPVRVAGRREVVKEWLDEHRHQLWAEALHRVREGAAAHLPPALHQAQRVAAETHRRADEALEDRLLNWMVANHERMARGASLDEMRHGLNLDVVDPRFATRLGQALRNLGCESRRTVRDGIRRRRWFAPDSGTS